MARPIAPRFEITTLKDKSGSDAAQVPVSATINFYRAGGTVSTAVTLPAFAEDYPVSVYDTGDLAEGDTVRVGTTSTTLAVTGVTAPSQVLVTSNLATALALSVGTRLVPTNNRPYVYSDPLAQVIIGDALTTDATTGRGSAYLSRNRVDYDVSISGVATRLYVDGAGIYGRSDQRVLDLRDYGGNLAAAIAALPADGGVVFVPRGTWLLSSGVVIAKPGVTILGEGPASVLKASTANSFDMITVDRAYFRMRDITLDGAATSYSSTGKSCLVMRGLSTSGHLVADEYLENVTITRAPRYGMLLQNVILFLAEQCRFDSSLGSGVRIESPGATPSGATTTRFLGCSFSQNGDRGCSANNVVGLTFMGCTLEGNQGGAGTYEGNGIEAESCARVEVLSCYFKSPNTTSAPGNFLALGSCVSALVDGCYFDGGPTSAKQPLRGIVFNTSPWSRLSNCTGFRLQQYLAWFEANSPDSCELGNTEIEADVNGTIVRLNLEALRCTSLSRRALSVPRHEDDVLLPDSSSQATPGTLVWVSVPDAGDSKLQIWDGEGWKNIAIS